MLNQRFFAFSVLWMLLEECYISWTAQLSKQATAVHYTTPKPSVLLQQDYWSEPSLSGTDSQKHLLVLMLANAHSQGWALSVSCMYPRILCALHLLDGRPRYDDLTPDPVSRRWDLSQKE